LDCFARCCINLCGYLFRCLHSCCTCFCPEPPQVQDYAKAEAENERRKLAEARGEPYDSDSSSDSDGEAEEIVNQVRGLLGKSCEPPNSEWLQLDRLSPKTGLREPMGKLCISAEILPAIQVEHSPAGHGQQKPNQNPYLPPPVNRLQFSLNPFVMGTALMGPKICCYVFCLLIVTAIILLSVFCQPVLNFIITFTIWTIKSATS